jgi:hypothetical protein
MSLAQRPFSELLAAFRSPDPTPGGGSASRAGGCGWRRAPRQWWQHWPKRAPSAAEDLRRLRAAGDRCAALSDRLSAR